jgi:hypothetical protein
LEGGVLTDGGISALTEVDLHDDTKGVDAGVDFLVADKSHRPSVHHAQELESGQPVSAAKE